MPANLPPEYFEAERHFKEAKTSEEKAAALEHLLSTIPKHKGTDKLRADLRRKLSKFKSQADAAKKKSGRHESNYSIEREGDARVVIIGMPNVGKSSFVSTLTNAKPEISDSPFTTWSPTPGMLNHEGIHIQLIDTPPLNRDFIEPDFLELIKSADLILIMIDLQAYPIPQFQDTVEILERHRIVPVHKKIDVPDKKHFQFPIVITVNKDDGEKYDEEFDVLNELIREEGWMLIPISVKANRNITELINFVVKELRLMRVYSKPPHHEADLSQPFVLKIGATVDEFAEKVHKDFVENLKSARVWGKGVHDGQHVGRDHVLNDGDIVELHV